MYLQYIHVSIMYGHLHKINQILIEKLGSLHKKIKTTLFPVGLQNSRVEQTRFCSDKLNKRYLQFLYIYKILGRSREAIEEILGLINGF